MKWVLSIWNDFRIHNFATAIAWYCVDSSNVMLHYYIWLWFLPFKEIYCATVCHQLNISTDQGYFCRVTWHVISSTCQVSHVMCELWRVTGHVSRAIRHVSCVMCDHVSCVITCHGHQITKISHLSKHQIFNTPTGEIVLNWINLRTSRFAYGISSGGSRGWVTCQH